MNTINKILYGSLLILASLFVLPSVKASVTNNTVRSYAVRSFPSLPKHELDTKFQAVQKGFEERSNLFLKGKHFQNWVANKKQNEIIEEFNKIDAWRNHSWYAEDSGDLLVSRADFMIAQDLLENGYYRSPDKIAFQYNQTDGSYNSSSIVLNGQRFLALEAPNEKSLKQFFKLLQNYQVTQLVNLSAAENNGEKQSYAYWNGRIKKDKKDASWINIPLTGIQKTFPIQFYSTEALSNNQKLDSKSLLKLIQSVREEGNADNGLIACQSSDGTGKAGTFIAGFLLIQEIDRQLAAGTSIDRLDISIEKIVMQLSLQRAYLVANADQYLSLYQLVDNYINSLRKKP